jgi:hypothetical protein
MKKILLWTVYGAFVVVLILGAANRSSLILNDGNEEQNANARNSENAANGNGNGQQERAQETGDSETHTDKANDHEWVTLEGVVLTIVNREMVIQIGDGQQIGVARRAWRFAQEQGFTPQIGDTIAVTGFIEDGAFAAAQIANLTNGQAATLRDENGHPLWATNSGEH